MPVNCLYGRAPHSLKREVHLIRLDFCYFYARLCIGRRVVWWHGIGEVQVWTQDLGTSLTMATLSHLSSRERNTYGVICRGKLALFAVRCLETFTWCTVLQHLWCSPISKRIQANVIQIDAHEQTESLTIKLTPLCGQPEQLLRIDFT